VLFQAFNVLNVRAEHGTAINRQLVTNWRLWVALAMVVMLQVAVVHWPPFQRLFGSVALSLADWALCFGVGSTVFVVEEIRKITTRGVRSMAASWRGLRAHPLHDRG
jgi:Ca2+-transporting ATPase